jgi:thiamine-monophosphate kinase
MTARSPSPDRGAPGARTLADLGEFPVIAEVTARYGTSERVLLGPGDDAAVVRVDGGRTVVSTDVLVDGRHFRRDWASAIDIGHRAAAQSLSDLNAMGAVATAVVVGLAAPGHLDLDWVLGLADGLAEECDLVGASVVGGDLTRSDLLTIAVTALGEVDGRPLTRAGARAGDEVALRGRQGWAAAGLAVLSRGFRSPRAVVEAYRRPQVPYGGGSEARAGGATALIDVSDGLLSELGHVAAASGVAIDVRSELLPVAEPLQSVGAAVGADPLSFVLGGGDDHALVATFPEGGVPAGWTLIGSVTEGSGVTVDERSYTGMVGFRHF